MLRTGDLKYTRAPQKHVEEPVSSALSRALDHYVILMFESLGAQAYNPKP